MTSPLNDLISQLFDNGRYREADRLARKRLRSEPGDMNAARVLALISLREGQLAEAHHFGEMALRLDIAGPAAHLLARELGLGLARAGLWEDAARWLSLAIAQNPDDPEVAARLERIRRPGWLAADRHDAGSDRTLQRYAAREGDRYIYVLDVVGTCNLRCPTCPVGNSPKRALGFMPMAMFEAILDKIERETPCPNPRINLYNWGEPLLHPELPRMIALIEGRGMQACLSSNLNIKRGLEATIAANPTELKISISGFTPESYGRTHARGNLTLVLDNMRRVRDLIDAHAAKTHVWVGHHIYRTNQDQVEEVRRFSEALGFAYHGAPAFYMPLERLVDAFEGRPNSRDGGIMNDLLTHPTVGAEQRRRARSGGMDCELRFNQTVINHDGTVALCCSVYDAPNMLGRSFLDADFQALEALKYKHSFCGVCSKHALDYAPAELSAVAANYRLDVGLDTLAVALDGV